MILIVLFFFHTLFTLLLFGFPSHFAHCSSSCSFLSASFPLERHSPSRVPPYSPIMLGFLLICPFGLLSPLLAFAFYARFFLVAQPIPSLPLFPIPFSASEHLCLCAVRQGLPLAFLLRRTRGLISIHYAAGVPRASPATRHPIAGLVPPKSPPPPSVPPLIARGWLGPRWVPETHKDKWHERQYT